MQFSVLILFGTFSLFPLSLFLGEKMKKKLKDVIKVITNFYVVNFFKDLMMFFFLLIRFELKKILKKRRKKWQIKK